MLTLQDIYEKRNIYFNKLSEQQKDNAKNLIRIFKTEKELKDILTQLDGALYGIRTNNTKILGDHKMCFDITILLEKYKHILLKLQGKEETIVNIYIQNMINKIKNILPKK